MVWASLAATGTGSLVFIDVTTDRRSRMKSEVDRDFISAQIQSKLMGRHFTVQIDKDLKRTAKSTRELLTTTK